MAKPEHSTTTSCEACAPAASLYVNYFELGHNPYEFLIELGQYRPSASTGGGAIGIHTRLAIAPPYAKLLSQLLSNAVCEHESEHGKIPDLAASENSPFDEVLRSLPEFERRARRLLQEAVANGAPRPTPAKDVNSPVGEPS
ncbi:MAG: hypothetical protein U0S50_10825 [Sphingopyxis sp.]|uniref:DUF3467 domain-containing protein n=1 Tax=Sphingopyxis sp. TaxID=1908224 RepID=UPI002AB9FC67|nr:DUF3467 domain-containing protein [Sphingopyxis sp.]MDZ3832299.1 hypothetical protein [Sphingopyxis sp.]